MSWIKNKLDSLLRQRINKKMRKRLRNHDFSLIASNCNGAFILHDLGMRFNSPFVNLWMKPTDYIRLLSNLKEYMSMELAFVREDGIGYPIGQLCDIRIYFQHYASEKEAQEKWETRKARLNYDDLFVLFTDQEGCTRSELEAFDRLPIQNKVVFTNRAYPELKSAFYIKGFEKQNSVGNCFDFEKTHIARKYYDQFDYVGWFNTGVNQ